jgi:hypothetical protein
MAGFNRLGDSRTVNFITEQHHLVHLANCYMLLKKENRASTSQRPLNGPENSSRKQNAFIDKGTLFWLCLKCLQTSKKEVMSIRNGLTHSEPDFIEAGTGTHLQSDLGWAFIPLVPRGGVFSIQDHS